jgi:Uma2 family endonuclease
MSAEPVPSTGGWQPDPMRQMSAAYTAADLADIPDDAPRFELVDGVLRVSPTPTADHQDISFLLTAWLRAHARTGYLVSQAVSVALGQRDTRIPDVVLRRAGGEGGARWLFTAEEIVLAVEIVSPGTRRADRFHKPAEYAAAGIPFYWRIEQDPVRVAAYRLAESPGLSGRREYELVADAADLLKLDQPFSIALPISDITP